MDKYTIYCTPEQTKKALELGAPIKEKISFRERRGHLKEYREVIPPTAEQMIGWLREQGEIIFIREYSDTHEIYWQVSHRHELNDGYSASHKEAALTTINAALKYLSNNDLTKTTNS